MKLLVYLLIPLLIVLHQDFWWWHTHEPMIFGFIPIGLFHHVCISLAAALVGYLAVKFCWPPEVEELDSAPGKLTSSRESRGRSQGSTSEHP